MNFESTNKISKYIKLGKADMHIHSNFSDGKPTIEEILTYVQKETDLDVVAITDHDTIEGALYAQEIAKHKRYHFDVVVGEEISCKEGHVIGLYLKKPIKAGLPASKAIKMIKRQGGVVLMPHPTRHVRVNTGEEVLDGVGIMTLIKEKRYIDAIEGINATPTLYRDNLSAMFVNDTLLFKAETGGSDAHILEAIGMGFTIFEGRSDKELKRALLFAQTRAVNKKWGLYGMFKYLFFFMPKGFRLFVATLMHGRKPRRIQIHIPKKNFNKLNLEMSGRSKLFSILSGKGREAREEASEEVKDANIRLS